MGAEAGELSVPALVGRDRRAGERHAESDGALSRYDRRFGPPRRDLSRGRAIAVGASAVAALAVAVWLFGLELSPDRFLAVLLVPALALRRSKKYLSDFVPFALLLVLYSTCRGLAHVVNPHPFYAPQLRLERFLFAGHVPTLVLQHALGTDPRSLAVRAAVGMTRLHFIVPPLLGFVLWTQRRALFYRFAATMLALSFAASLVFLAYPSAPPWAASQAHRIGAVSHLTKHASTGSAAGGLASTSVTHLIPQNPYAAIPSLHAGYALVAFLFVASLFWGTRWRWPVTVVAAFYPLLQATAVVYTGDHYVVDALSGFAFATAAFVGVRKLWSARGLPL